VATRPIIPASALGERGQRPTAALLDVRPASIAMFGLQNCVQARDNSHAALSAQRYVMGKARRGRAVCCAHRGNEMIASSAS
jgi:hypothetical protein